MSRSSSLFQIVSIKPAIQVQVEHPSLRNPLAARNHFAEAVADAARSLAHLDLRSFAGLSSLRSKLGDIVQG